VAIGNTLRGDDGVAERVADLLEPRPGVKVRRMHQLTPELSDEVARAETVILVDADVEAREVYLDRIHAAPGRGTVTHSMTPGELIAFAERLYGFHGTAYMCHIPVENFEPGEQLSALAAQGAEAAARRIMELLGNGFPPAP
jgi:hydrogenase maturation protease